MPRAPRSRSILAACAIGLGAALPVGAAAGDADLDAARRAFGAEGEARPPSLPAQAGSRPVGRDPADPAPFNTERPSAPRGGAMSARVRRLVEQVRATAAQALADRESGAFDDRIAASLAAIDVWLDRLVMEAPDVGPVPDGEN